ncbi:MAG: hypothetical protein AB1428_00070 [Bacteroidota bacterium]
MRHAGVVAAIVILAAAVATAQTPAKVTTLKGYVVDQMCAKNMAKKENVMEKAAGHTKECALEESCAESGYGIFSEGKYYKFDDKGSVRAKDLIEKSKREKELAFEASGTLSGGTFTVTSLKETAAGAPAAKPPKKD